MNSKLIELTPETHPLWDKFIDSHPEANVYHHRGWERVARNAYRLETRFLMVQNAQGEVTGACPFFTIPGPFEGHITTGLFGSYGTILSTESEARDLLVNAAHEMLQNSKVKFFILKSTRPESLPWHGVQSPPHWVIAKLQLGTDPDALWKGFEKRIRNRVRNAEKFGLEIKIGHDQVKPFYAALSDNMYQKGAPLYGLRFMEEILAGFGDRAQIVTVWNGKEVISGAMLLFHNKVATVPFAASRPSSFNMSPNNLLYWEIIKLCYQKGFETLDFGSSLRESSSLDFKTSWGAQVFDQHTYVLNRLPSAKEAKLDRGDPFIERFVAVWKRTPRFITDRLGPVICRRVLA